MSYFALIIMFYHVKIACYQTHFFSLLLDQQTNFNQSNVKRIISTREQLNDVRDEIPKDPMGKTNFLQTSLR